MTDEVRRHAGALEGLNVLDLTHYVAGPYATKLMAALGANVIKLERTGSGDPMRLVGPFYGDTAGPDRGCPFLYLNTDKQSITLDLKHREGIDIFKRLVEWADVVVESFRPGVMADLGIAYDVLEQINPALIMVSVSNFGQTGPYRDYPMTDLTAQALGGLMNELGEPDNVPVKLGGYQALYAAGVAAFTATMTALVARDLNGLGQHVDVSILEMVAYTEWHASSYYAYNKEDRRRIGRFNQWKILRAKDGHMAVVGDFAPIQRFAGEVLADERFATDEGRLEHTLEWGTRLESWLMQQEKLDLYHRGQAAGVPWGYVADFEDVMQSPQYEARSFFRELEHPVAGKATYPGQPFRIGDLAYGPWQAAPTLGQHNDQVYGGILAIEAAEQARLRDSGVI